MENYSSSELLVWGGNRVLTHESERPGGRCLAGMGGRQLGPPRGWFCPLQPCHALGLVVIVISQSRPCQCPKPFWTRPETGPIIGWSATGQRDNDWQFAPWGHRSQVSDLLIPPDPDPSRMLTRTGRIAMDHRSTGRLHAVPEGYQGQRPSYLVLIAFLPR